jgi:tyrosyl-tRNA synthetase
MDLFADLDGRGLVKQITNRNKLEHLLNKESVTFYIGFDPTADSLHVGHLLQLVTARRLIQAGHKAILLIGGATALVGDPTGKTEMRKMLSAEEINANAESIESQMRNIVGLPFKVINNILFHSGTNWLSMLRDVGPFFSVNNMLRADCFKSRMENGLSFLEFNYMIMQAKDFHILNIPSGDNCILQIGGDDQWSNILAGIDLIHKKEGREAFGLTLPLLVNSSGQKMGKTEKGAVWLDSKKTSPFDFFQFWRNIPDGMIGQCFKFFTFLSLEEIEALPIHAFQDDVAKINAAKKLLAFEITKIVHGPEEASKALDLSEALFENKESSALEATIISNKMQILDLLVKCGFAKSRNDGRNLIKGGGVTINDTSVTDPLLVVNRSSHGDSITIKKGKKHFAHFIIEE